MAPLHGAQRRFKMEKTPVSRRTRTDRVSAAAAFVGITMFATGSAHALTDCNQLPDHATLQVALVASVASANGTASTSNGGFDLDMWATVVNRDGEVCAVAFTGGDRGDQWPGSRVISGQKANTANAFSLPGLSLSTGNLWAATQPGGSLFGLQHSNPVDTAVAYGKKSQKHGDSDATRYGQHNDPMVGSIVGGVNVFGGGLALYAADGTLLGAVGVSGDTSCADHNIAWRVRDTLGLDYVPGGVGTPGDNIIHDVADDSHGNPESASGFGHPKCGGPGAADGIDPDDGTDNAVIVGACQIGDGTTPGCV